MNNYDSNAMPNSFHLASREDARGDQDERHYFDGPLLDIEDDEYDVEDEPLAEVDNPTTDAGPKPSYMEPSYERASAVSFSRLSQQMEYLYRLKTQNVVHPPDKVSKLKRLLPPALISKISRPTEASDPPQSLFPILRLLLPERDGSRRLFTKENTLAKAYGRAFGLPPASTDYQKLLYYSDPHIVGSKSTGTGDFSEVLRQVLEKRISLQKNGSGVTVGQVNALLDELAVIGKPPTRSNHDWRNREAELNDSQLKPKYSASKAELQANWVTKLHCLGLTPLEHKWIIRIILERLQITLGSTVILAWYHPLAPSFWSAHNSLKAVCNKLCQPGVFELRHNLAEDGGDEDEAPSTLAPYFKSTHLTHVQLGNPFSPMASERTGFHTVLSDMSSRHRDFTGEERCYRYEAVIRSLAFKFPTFAIETKLDGERLLVHYFRNGTVKLHTRQGSWYSELYSPVLGPALRRAVGKHDLDLILDGEVLAWDNERHETVPFGNNRTIAKMRYSWMRKAGILDKRDINLHNGENDVKRINSSNSWNTHNTRCDEVGEECWLQFIAFDVLYINGPHALDFLSKTVSSFALAKKQSGSIVDLECLERKKILYELIDEQDNEVEIVPTVVVRPNGQTSPGHDYFRLSNPTMECGFPARDLDSIARMFHQPKNDLGTIDAERRHGLSDELMRKARAQAVESHYRKVVEDMRLEGLLFKDLSTPYILDKISRSFGYWRKFKPDYFNGSVASDLDVVIIGAYFASGLRLSGKPSSFLCACTDSCDSEYYFPMCKVNAGSMDRNSFSQLLYETGFRAPCDRPDPNAEESKMEYGRWFREEDHGKALPDFITDRSHQNNSRDGRWRFRKEDYPDIWINPSDSCVLTLNAGDIVSSEAFPSGLTLRFPRIVKVRIGADTKDPTEVESDRSLQKILQQVLKERCESKGEANGICSTKSFTRAKAQQFCRFLTEEEYVQGKNRKKSTGRSKTLLLVPTSQQVMLSESKVLTGLSFHVLDGRYSIDSDDVAVDEATEEGWLEKALSVRSSNDVKHFIARHNGKVLLNPDSSMFVIGGSETDARVITYIQAINRARTSLDRRTKEADRYRRIAGSAGVLRWTFVFSFVQRHLGDADVSTSALMFNPTMLDFLKRAQIEAEELEFMADLSSKSSLRRALGLTSKRKRTGSDSFFLGDWRERVFSCLPTMERCILSCRVQSVGPFKSVKADTPSSVIPSVVYPVTVNDDTIESVLPLARMMGAVVVREPRKDLTHVVCHMIVHDIVKHKRGMLLDLFENREQGTAFKRILDDLQIKHNLSHDILFVTPNWIRAQWSSHAR